MLSHNSRISLYPLSHGSRRRTEWMTVTASCDVGVVEAQKSGGKNHPKSASCRSGCVMRTRTVGRHFKKWEQSTARATARCCQKCDGHCVTGNVYSSSGSLYHRVNNTKYQICLGMCFLLTYAYSLRSQHENKTLKWVWSWWACETDYEQRQTLWHIEWKCTIKTICIQTIRLRRLAVPGTVLKPQLSIIPDLDRPCNNPWKESLIVWGYIYMWHL